MSVLITTDPAVLTIDAPDGTPVTATMSEGDPMYATVLSGQAKFTGGIGRTIVAITVGDMEAVGADSYRHEDYDRPVADAYTDLNYSPVTPSDPFVESRAGSVAVTWDGLGSGGEAMPVNLYRVEIHRSVEGAAFVTDATTYAATLYIAGTHVFSDQTYGVEWWYKLVTLDQAGLRSTDSAAMPGTANRIVGADIEANTITANEIAADTITTVELAATAIDGMTITGAKIRTVASGARWELGTTPALIESSAETSGGGVNAGLRLMSPDITADPGSSVARIDIEALDPTIGANSSLISMTADKTQIIGPAQINGPATLLDTLDIPGGRVSGSCAGSMAIGALVVGASSGSINVNFPAGHGFTTAPAVVVTPGSARLTMAVVSISTVGFTCQAENYSDGNAGANTGYWVAVAR
jgi:hypothetical protein